MKAFKIYKHPIIGYEAVKEGFNWSALFFNFFWLITKKLWGIAIIWMIIFLVLASIHIIVYQSVIIASQPYIHVGFALGYFGLCFIPALSGNQWRDKNLLNRGFELLSLIEATVPDAAIAIQAKKDQQVSLSESDMGKKSDEDSSSVLFEDEIDNSTMVPEDNIEDKELDESSEKEQVGYIMPFITHYEFEIEHDDNDDDGIEQIVDELDGKLDITDGEDEEFDQDETNNPIVQDDEIEYFEIPGLKHQTIGGHKQGLKTMEVWLQTMAPRSVTPVHCHNCEEVIYVLSGYGKCTIGNEGFEFGPNATLIIKPDVVHQLVNTSHEELKLISTLGMAPVRLKTAAGSPLTVPWEASDEEISKIE